MIFKAIYLILFHTYNSVVLDYFGAKFRVNTIYKRPSHLTQSDSKDRQQNNPFKQTQQFK